MADNVTADAGSGGAVFVTANFTFSGDSAHAPGCFSGLLAGSEGAWTYTLLAGGAGAVTAGTQRVTLASDDPAVVALQLIDNLVLAEDAAHGSGDPGVQLLAVRTDSPANRSGADGDYEPLQVSAGRLWVSASNNGTFAVQAAQSGTWTVTGAGGSFPVTDSGGSLTVDAPVGTPVFVRLSDGSAAIITLPVSLAGTVTVDTELPAAAVLADNALNPTAPAVGAFLMAWDGATWDRAPGTSADGLLVNLGGNNDVTVTGTVTANAGTNLNTSALALEAGGNLAAAATSLAVLDDWDSSGACKVVGPAAHDAAASGNPVLVGAEFDDATPDAVDEGDAGRLRISANRNLYTTLRDAAGNERGASVNASNQLSVSVDNTVAVASHAVTNAGTFAVQESGAALAALELVDNIVSVVDGAAGATPTGVAALAIRDDALSALAPAEGDFVGLRTGSTGALWVATASTVTVAGTVTANAGTNLNTSALALEAGGNLALAATALQLIDNLVLAEDAAHGSGDPGVQLLAVRKDSGAALAGSDGDYSPLQVDDAGNLRVNIAAGAAAGGTSATDDADFTAGATAGTPVMGVYQTSAVDVTDTDLGICRITQKRALHVALFDSAGNEVAVGGGTQYDEDAAHSSGSKVTGCGIVRKDTAAALAGTDGDYTLPIADANGKLWVNASGLTLTVDGSGVTQPVSHAALTELAAAIDTELQCDIVGALPAGTNAIGKLAANSGVDIGDVDVASVLPGTGAQSLGKAEDAAHSSGDVGVMALAVRQDTAAALAGTDGDYQPLITDGSGRLHVNVGNTVAVASHAVTNAGTFAVQVDGSALAALQLIDDPVFADDAAFTIGTSKVMMAGATVDETSTDSADEGDAVALRATADRKLVVTTKPTAAGEGCDVFRSIDLDESEEDVKTSAGMLYGYYFANLHATAARHLKFYNATAANVTVGTTTPFLTLPLPAASAGHVALTHPVKFDTAICAAATTGVADNDTGAPGANEVVLNVFYK